MNGASALGPNALVTMGLMINGNSLMITVLSPYMAVCPSNFLYKRDQFLQR